MGLVHFEVCVDPNVKLEDPTDLKKNLMEGIELKHFMICNSYFVVLNNPCCHGNHFNAYRKRKKSTKKIIMVSIDIAHCFFIIF